ncbi:MAG: Phosphatidylcholine synthase [Firmicutes bacterium ADurb.Bin456]|nr:MAG: Phosphatidylcholine synthase [Firmicutes bacterium ADurb.Bin456]
MIMVRMIRVIKNGYVNRLGILPNICTAANLLLGFSAIAFMLNGSYRQSVILIVLAAVLDRFDGFLARRCKAVSSFGREFDSLADLVSFGVAPATLLYVTALNTNLSTPGLICAGLFTLCGSLRLARFNISESTPYFTGIPITFAGALLAVMIIVIPGTTAGLTLSLLLSLGMISTIRIPKI